MADKQKSQVVSLDTGINVAPAGDGQTAGPDAVGVDKIRDLLFGNQMQDYDRRFSKLEERFLQRFKDTESETARNLSAYDSNSKKQVESLASQLREEKDLRADGDKEIERSLREQTQSLENEATAFLAAQKMEQLRSLSWTFDEDGGLRSDTSTDLSRDPPTVGGFGLDPTPSGSLDRSLDGCVDYLDAAGHWVGTGTTPPAGSVYVRRWAVLPGPIDPAHTRALVVIAAALEEESRLAGRTTTSSTASSSRCTSSRPRLPQDAVLVTLKVRQAGAP